MKKYIGIIAITAAALLAVAAGLWYHQIVKQNDKFEETQSEVKSESDKKPESVQTVEPELSEEEQRKEEVEEIVNSLTLDEKVAQLFIVTPEELTGVEVVIAAGETTQNAISQYPVGGFIYMSQNLENPEQVREMVKNVQEYSYQRIGLPLFISVDEEGGTVSRFSNNPNFNLEKIDSMSVIGATGDPQNAYNVGAKIGSFLYDLGFNMDNAPDADVLTNPSNTVIGSRSFGTDCNLVSEMMLAEMKGLQDQNIIPVIKHYPGHGATEADTHAGYAYTNKTLNEMMANELVPFINGINAGVKVIMAAHISCPNIVGDNTPSSLSGVMINDILRGQLGYQGVVTTDALNMGAIAEEYSSGQAAVQALQAGVDILLMPENFQEAYQGVLSAVGDGRLTEERINESVRRIVNLKLDISQK